MFGVSFLELLLILAVALVVFGPDRLPEVARSLGKIMGDLQRTSDQLRRELYRHIYSAPEVKAAVDTAPRKLENAPEQLSAPGEERTD